MDVLAVTSGLKAGPALAMTGRLPKILDDYLRYHQIEGSTEATVKFYAKEVRLFLRDLDSECQALGDITPFHVLSHLGNMKNRGLAPRSIRTRWQAITTWLNWCVAWELIKPSPASQDLPNSSWYHWHEQLDYYLIPPRSCPTSGAHVSPLIGPCQRQGR